MDPSPPDTGARTGTLFVVATPIGNLGDLSPRARETLGSVAAICAERLPRTRRQVAQVADRRGDHEQGAGRCTGVGG